MQYHNVKIKAIIAIIAILLFVIGLFFIYFHNTDITKNKPELRYASEIKNNIISNLSLAIKIDLKNLDEQIDNLIPKKYNFSDRKNKCIKTLLGNVDCKIQGYITKSGDVSISTFKNYIQLKVPFYIKVGVAAGFVKETFNTHLDLIIKFHPKISPNWVLSLDDMKVNAVLNECYTKLIGVKISVCSLIEKPIEKALKKIDINKLKAINLHAKIKKIWQQAHSVNKISSNHDIYLTTEPKTLDFSGFDVINDTLIANISLGVKFNIVTGHKPNKPKYVLLPNLGNNIKNGFSISLPIRVSYAALKDVLEKELIGKDFNYPIEVKNIEVYPSADNLVIGVYFKIDSFLASNGVAYFSGKFVIDNKNKTIKIDNLKLTSISDNNLVDILAAMISLITNQPVYDFSNDYKNLIATINNNPHTFDNMKLDIELNEQSIQVQELQLLKDGIYIGMVINGSAELNNEDGIDKLKRTIP